MAGLYNDPPDNRMELDKDGSIHFIMNWNSGTTSTPSAGQINDRCGEASSSLTLSGSNGAIMGWGVVFPEIRNIKAYNVNMFYGSAAGISAPYRTEWSANTTNGIDGTWTNLGQPGFAPANRTGMRQNSVTVNLTGVRGFRLGASIGVSGSVGITHFHLYGAITSGNDDRLIISDPTTDIPVLPAHFDFGDVPRGGPSSSPVRQFRIKNNSSTLTANSIGLATTALTDGGTPTTVASHSYSPDGVTYTSTLNIGNLAPGALSSVIYVKYNPISTSTTGLRWARIEATATSWT